MLALALLLFSPLSIPAMGATTTALSACPPTTLERMLQTAKHGAIGDLKLLNRLPIQRFQALRSTEIKSLLNHWTPTSDGAFVILHAGSPEKVSQILSRMPEGSTWGLFDDQGQTLYGPTPRISESPEVILGRGQNFYRAILDWGKITKILVDRKAFEKRFEVPLPKDSAPYTAESGWSASRWVARAQKPQELDALFYIYLEQLKADPTETIPNPGYSETMKDQKTYVWHRLQLLPGEKWILDTRDSPGQAFPELTPVEAFPQPYTSWGVQFRPSEFAAKPRPTRTPWNSETQTLKQIRVGEQASLLIEGKLLSGIIVEKSPTAVKVLSSPTETTIQAHWIELEKIKDWIPGPVPDARWGAAGRKIATPSGIKEITRFIRDPKTGEISVRFSDGSEQAARIPPFVAHPRAVEFAQLSSQGEITYYPTTKTTRGLSSTDIICYKIGIDETLSTGEKLVLISGKNFRWDSQRTRWHGHPEFAAGKVLANLKGGSLQNLVAAAQESKIENF